MPGRALGSAIVIRSNQARGGNMPVTVGRPAPALGSPQNKNQPPEVGCSFLPDDVVETIARFVASMLLDVLAFAVVSRQYGVAIRDVCKELLAPGQQGAGDRQVDAKWLLTERMASHFLRWAEMPVNGQYGSVSAADIEMPGDDDDALVYHCCRCRSPILRFGDIVSMNYHGAWGPAFLVNRLYNSAVERVAYAAAFVTGGYTVSDVGCSVCRLMLGKKYIEARDPVNFFKVGKYLLEQTMVFLPGCCSGARMCRSPLPGMCPQGVCVRCVAHLQSRTLQAALLMTDDLSPSASRQLRHCLAIAIEEPLWSEEETSTSKKCNAAGDRSSFQQIWQEQVCSGEGYIRLRKRLAAFMGSVPGKIQGRLFCSFVERVAAAVAISGPSDTWVDDDELAMGLPPGGSAWRISASQATPGGVLRPGPGLVAASLAASGTTAAGTGTGPRGSRGSATQQAAAQQQQLQQQQNAAMGPGSQAEGLPLPSENVAGSEGAVGSMVRLLRWDLAAAAGSAVAVDFEVAKRLISGLKTTWQPVWPLERPGAERLVNMISRRLDLDKEDADELRYHLGLKKKQVMFNFCSWFACRLG
eukprot:TRINITY_DN17866_c0_g1_i1.p1 TRINITY_DN17866_c0_g1~~TRINITY_DN17866_c0_g1_i1.p1  ORF type:complete len:584 (+),score=128.38 TRINITY_DN17866_c0_g1_i1:135-1886(+)